MEDFISIETEIYQFLSKFHKFEKQNYMKVKECRENKRTKGPK